VCRRCGYAYYGKTAPQSKRDPLNGVYYYYRCIGTDGHRFDGHAVRDNPQIRGDYLEQAVWDRVRALLEDPDRMTGEYHRRWTQTHGPTGSSDDVLQLERQITRLQRGIGRLIDSYAEGVIEPSEFQPRIAGLKARRA
jgi:site-specific DNA recombinase